MRKGLFGRLFDWNHDGKLDLFERGNEIIWLQTMAKEYEEHTGDDGSAEIDWDELEQWLKDFGSQYSGKDTWRDKYGRNIFGLSTENFETEEAFLKVLDYFSRTQSQWIANLKPEELAAAKRYGIDPKQYVYPMDFREVLEIYLRNEVAQHDEEDAMKITTSKKKVFLQDTFELLKDNYCENRVSLVDIIGKMAKIDLACSVEMWKTLIFQYPDVLHGGSDFGFNIMFVVEKVIGGERIYRLVAEDVILKNAVFSELGNLRHTPLDAIRFFIFSGAIDLADELLALVYRNKYRSESFYDVLKNVTICYNGERLTEEGFEMLMKWIDTLSNREEKAKMNLVMLNFMEEE